jgi:poly(A) polymerase
MIVLPFQILSMLCFACEYRVTNNKKPMQTTDHQIHDTWWLSHDGITQIFKAVEAAGGEIRFVGGCVRDSIIGRDTTDIDCATTMKPEQVIDTLRPTGVKVIPTGIDHGTVTAVLDDGKQVEITTLRRDVKTHGRYADVAYTDDWKTDAARRDFTINAMSCDLSGQVYDPYGGISDIKHGNIIFIGDPMTRIQEDYLRILRFFRFFARFGQGKINADGLQAAMQLAPQMAKLSGERIRDELLKILIAPRAVDAITVIFEHGILEPVLPYLSNMSRFKNMVRVERLTRLAAHSIRRLAAICGDGPEAIEHTATRLRLSNDQTDCLRAMKEYPGQGDWPHITAENIKQLIYQHDKQTIINRYCFQLAENGADQPDPDVMNVLMDWTPPEFPLTGHDVMEMGIPAGPKIGRLMDEVEQWWIDQDFNPDRKVCLEKLKGSL